MLVSRGVRVFSTVAMEPLPQNVVALPKFSAELRSEAEA